MILERTTHLGAKSENDPTKRQRQEKKADEENVSQNGKSDTGKYNNIFTLQVTGAI